MIPLLPLQALACLFQEGKDKKGKKDAPSAAAMDVVSIDELNQKIATLEKEKSKEEEYRNYMQLERVISHIDSRIGSELPHLCWQAALDSR